MRNSGIQFDIYYKVPGSEGVNLLSFTPGQGGGNATPEPGQLLLQAIYMPNRNRYNITLIIDGANYPAPVNGFTTIGDLWAWVSTNWATLGNWYFLPANNKIVLYANNATTGSMDITSENVLQALFPPLEDDQYFIVIFDGQQSPGELLYTPDDTVQWVTDNWGEGGTWTTDGVYLIYTTTDTNEHTLEILASSVGAFDDGFNGGFES